MFVYYYYCLLLLLGTDVFATNFGKIDDQRKVFLEENLANRIIDEHGLRRSCCKNINTIKFDGHKFKNHPEIPLNIIMEMNQVTSVSELFWKFMPHIDPNEVLEYYNSNDEQNSTVIVPKAAVCTTENRTVSLKDSDDPSLYYSPSCTRVKRCGGCCGSVLLSCQPTAVEMLNFEVTVLEYNGTFTFKEKKIVTVEQHVKCKCDCILKEQDCTPRQVYNARECRCICNNLEEQNICEEQEKKLWDFDTCSCQCIDVRECSTGLYFNHNTCECEHSDNKKNPRYHNYMLSVAEP